ncbi:hypothetical protein J5U18_09445 [Sphingobacteriaceae bacterium WQ 2009]|uniref:DUF5362 domain-containing protein n=1 Tax=Rhinopithecimicrobium faecis TaxID=2820698 RepID=A0A8T4HCD5_9SPHI|nr:hypothetical protein [Sphingobacteriaceae bacterium WQ 2009]
MEYQSESPNLHLEPATNGFLLSIAKWTRFLSIIGLIFIGLLVLLAAGIFLFSSTFASVAALNDPKSAGPGAAALFLSGGFMTFTYLVIALFYFFPIYYLYKFSSLLKQAITTRNSELLTESFKNLKSHFKFIGIITLIIVGFYALILLLTLIGGASFLMQK